MRRISTRSALALAAALATFASLAAAPRAVCAPVVRILRPALVSRYEDTVEVEGQVTVAGKSQPLGASPSAVCWRVLDTDLGGSLSLDEQGRFAIRFSTTGMPDVIYVEVTAADPAGQAAHGYVALLGPRSVQTAATAAAPGPSRLQLQGPELSILSPPPGAEVAQTVRVEGTAAGRGAPLAHLSWRVPAAGLGEEIPIPASGRFAFEVPTEGLQEAFTVALRAEDRQGAAAERSVDLRRDLAGPALVVDSPPGMEPGAGLVAVRGRIGDRPGPPWSIDAVRSLSWRLLDGQGTEQPVDYGPDGRFELRLPAAGLTEPLLLELRGVDAAGNATTVALSLPAAQGRTPPSAPPELRITAPTPDSRYASTVRVQGRVANSAGDPAADRIASLRWSLRGTGRAGRVDFQPDGGFSFEVPTEDLQGTLALELAADSGDGARARQVLALLDDEKGPELVVEAEGGSLHSRDRIRLQGRVGDPIGSPERLKEVRSIDYRIGAAEPTALAFGPDGAFDLSIAAAGLSGPQTVRLTAEDRNGHRSERVLRLADGNLRPSLMISEPVDGYLYGSSLRVRGRVTDPYAGIPGMQGIAEVRYEAVSREVYAQARSPAAGTVRLGPEGSFDFIVSTRELTGAQEMRLSVTAASGNTAQAAVVIEEAEADVPSFEVSWTGAEAVATWQELPAAEGYTLQYWKENPGAPRGAVSQVKGVRPPHRLPGLEHGNLYALRVLAAAPGQPESWSATRSIIPVYAASLRPEVSREYGQIRISWPAVPGSRRYRVWRSVGSPEGQHTDISGSVSETVYVDTQVSFGRRYYYRIAPADFPGSRSEAAWAETTPYPEKRAVSRGESPCQEGRQITLSGDYALLAAGARGVRVIDVGVPDAPSEAGIIPAQAACDVAVRGQMAYVADGPYGLKVFDITEPRAPVQVGFRDTADARGVLLLGNLAVVADGERGLKILDVSRAVEPLRVAWLDTLAAFDLALREHLLYVAAGPQGLRTVDLSDPLHPTELGGCETHDARRLAVRGNLAFVADGAQGLTILDLADPARPKRVAGYHSPRAVDVAVNGRFVYLADEISGLIVLDISDPLRPVQFAELGLAGAAGLAVRGSYAYAATASGLQAIHVVNEGTSFSIASCPIPGGAYAVSIDGERAYVSGHRAGVTVVDLSEPELLDPGFLRETAPSDYALHVLARDGYAYVAQGRRGIRIVNLAGPQPPEGSFFTGGSAWRLAAHGDRLYVADGEGGLKVLSLADPLHPVELAAVATVDARDVLVRGSLLYLADGEGGLKIFDLAAGEMPQEIACLQLLDARRVAAAGDLAAVCGPEGVELVRVRDPRRPAWVGSYATAHAEGLQISGACLYLAEGHRGLSVLDISDPERPEVISRCPDLYAVDVAVRGEFAFVPDADRLHVVRVLIPRWLAPKAEVSP